MEDFAGGVLIATTNLTVNLDKAFERRFLYKIEFKKPDIQTKNAIWLDRMPGLSCLEAEKLACRFDFSGGQIENIARKETVSAALRGYPLSLDEIIALCEDELLEKEAARIGFCM
jgi:SpoVK/Ycf46/Vps4 family AAA+-type ATPase